MFSSRTPNTLGMPYPYTYSPGPGYQSENKINLNRKQYKINDINKSLTDDLSFHITDKESEHLAINN